LSSLAARHPCGAQTGGGARCEAALYDYVGAPWTREIVLLAGPLAFVATENE